jgi:hypothetical protein
MADVDGASAELPVRLLASASRQAQTKRAAPPGTPEPLAKPPPTVNALPSGTPAGDAGVPAGSGGLTGDAGR